MKQIDLREGARRQHRAVGLYAVIQCWFRGWDGVIIQRGELERLIGLERFKGTRVKWLQHDLRDFFPHQQLLVSGGGFASLVVSRLPLDKLARGRMYHELRIKRTMDAGGPKLGMLRIWRHLDREKLGEAVGNALPFIVSFARREDRILSAYLTLLANGQIGPQAVSVKGDTAAE